MHGEEDKKTLTSLISALHLTSADVECLRAGPNSSIARLIGGRNVLEVLATTSTSYGLALDEIAALKDDIEILEADLHAARKGAGVAAMTPPASPDQERTTQEVKGIEMKLKTMEERVKSAEKEREGKQAMVEELRSRLLKAESALKGELHISLDL